MKRQYSKPDILFESFTLSSSISSNCEMKFGNPSQFACGQRFGTEILFLSSMTNICTAPVEDGKPSMENGYDGICYHVPAADNNMFNS